jgi:hypothetical protein
MDGDDRLSNMFLKSPMKHESRRLSNRSLYSKTYDTVDLPALTSIVRDHLDDRQRCATVTKTRQSAKDSLPILTPNIDDDE